MSVIVFVHLWGTEYLISGNPIGVVVLQLLWRSIAVCVALLQVLRQIVTVMRYILWTYSMVLSFLGVLGGMTGCFIPRLCVIGGVVSRAY
jgi:hypothetical protein